MFEPPIDIHVPEALPATWQECVETIRSLWGRKTALQWELADLAALADEKWNMSVREIADSADADYETIRRYMQVAASWPIGMRIPSASFYHHQVAATWPDRAEWVDRAAVQGWSAREMKRRNQLSRGIQLPLDAPEGEKFLHRLEKAVSALGRVLETMPDTLTPREEEQYRKLLLRLSGLVGEEGH